MSGGQYPVVGQTVRVISGFPRWKYPESGDDKRKTVRKGTTGVVIWTRGGYQCVPRVGVQVTAGDRFSTYAYNLEVVSNHDAGGEERPT